MKIISRQRRLLHEVLCSRGDQKLFDPLYPAIIVGVIRIVALGIGAILAYLGYRLFFAVPQQSESGGKIETPGLTITVSRIAPGTFFAICSVCILVASFIYPIKITSEGVIGAVSHITSENRHASELRTAATTDRSAIDANAAHITNALRQLACIRGKFSLKDDERTAVDQARVALMARIWREKWGSFKEFEAWALEGRGGPPVTAVEHIFSQKDPRC